MAKSKDKASEYVPLFVHVRGILPALQSNGRLVNPLDPYTKTIKAIAAKKSRDKSDADAIAMMEAQFKGSLYCYDDKAGGPIYWPADNIHACLKRGAKECRAGPKFDSAVIVEHPGGRLIYDGPQTRDALWADQSFHFVKSTRRGTMSCRPIFNDWECQFSLSYIAADLDRKLLLDFIMRAGRIGLSAWPRRFGLFTVVEIRDEKVEIAL